MHNLIRVISLNYQRGDFFRSTIGLLYFLINLTFAVLKKTKILITICKTSSMSLKLVYFFHVWEECEYVRNDIILLWLNLCKECLMFDTTSTKSLVTKKGYSWFIYW